MLYAAAIPLEVVPMSPMLGTPARVLGLVVGYLWIIKVFLSQKRIRVSRVGVGMLMFSVWALMSLAWAKTLLPATSYAFSLIQLSLALFAIIDSLRSCDDVNRVMTAYSISAIGVAVWSVFHQQVYGDTGRLVFAQQVGPAHFAAMLLLPTLFLLGREIQARSRRERVISLLGLITLIYAIFASGTRSALVGILVGSAVLAWSDKKARFWVFTLMLGTVMILAYERSLYTRFIVDAVEFGGSGRLDIWNVGLSLVSQNPIIGVGIANFPAYFTAEVIARTGSILYSAILLPGRDAHNIYLQILVELGVLGLALFLIPLGRLVLRLAKQAGSTQRSLLACLAGYLVQGLFLPILNRKYFWITIGLAVVGVLVEELSKQPRPLKDGPSQQMGSSQFMACFHSAASSSCSKSDGSL